MRTTMILLAATLMLSWGCTGHGSPILPGSGSSAVPMLSNRAMGGPSEILWGLYDIAIDAESGLVEVAPLRGAMFEANATKFLQPPFTPYNYVTVNLQPETDLPKGYIVANVGIQHPFPSTNLRGFDVMGIFIAPSGGHTSTYDPSVNWPSPDEARLLNADGFTRWWNMVEFTSCDTIFGYTEGAMAPHGFSSTCILSPFKYYANGLGPDDPWDPAHVALTDRGSFDTLQPGFLARRYEIQFPPKKAADYRFKYAVSSSWTPPNPGTTPPAGTDDFPITANRAEAVQVNIFDTGSTAYYHSPTDFGGFVSISVTITDWQGTTSPAGAMEQISAVIVESPTLFDGALNLLQGGEPWSPPYSGTLYIMTLFPVSPVTTTNQELLFTVISRFPVDFSSQPPGFDVPDAELAAYNVWTVPVKSD